MPAIGMEAMKYVVYCDESRHDAQNHRYMAIGGLWVPEPKKTDVSHAFRSLCRELSLNAEVKWNKTSEARLASYKRLVDFFFDTPGLKFRVIVVEHSKIDNERFHGGDSELAFYKFYYQMLKAWILKGNEYLLLLDKKQNCAVGRYGDLRQMLDRRAKNAEAIIRDLTIIDSSETPLAQLCDILTGAVAATYCVDTKGAKSALANHIALRIGLQHLRFKSASPHFNKFNVFQINLGL